jgi:lipoprotein-anchoring transpeptidase ErfK/SrfK
MRKLAALVTAATVVAWGGLAAADGASPLAPPAPPAPRPAPAPAAAESATPGARAAANAGDTVARVVRPTLLRRRPGGRRLAVLARRTEFGVPQVLAVEREAGRWLGVLHPALPNGRIGWVPRDAVRLSAVPLSIEVDLSDRLARVRRGDRVVERFRVGVGRPASPTPTGRFAITDRLLSGPSLPYGCCVLALSGRQPNLPAGWGGGDRLALHGVADESRVGKATSFGCLHVRERDLRPLLRRVRAGARVTIRA